jgi:TPR repeat protein
VLAGNNGRAARAALFLFCCLSFGVCAQPDRAMLRELLAAERFAELDAYLSENQAAYRRGTIGDQQVFEGFVALTTADSELRPLYDRWVTQYPRSYAARLARAYYLSGLGWAARGSGYFHEMPAHRIEDMRAYFRDAMQDLKVSVTLDTKPVLSYATMIRVARADRSFGDIALYLDQALALDPRAYNARMSYLLGIRPEWGGSLERMASFVAEAGQVLPAEQTAKLQRVLDNSRAREALAPGEHLASAGQYGAAVEHYDAVLAQRPSPRGYAARGYAYLRLKQHDKAIADFDRALELDPDDQCCGNTHSNRGASYLATGALAKALPDLVHAAERMDDHWAARELAGMYAYGWHGTRVDPKRARPWCERAARQGDAWSMYCLGHVYRTGWGGVRPDAVKGHQWMQRAAERGIAGAQYDLGWIYWGGEGVSWNGAKAFYWWVRAALQGDLLALGRVVTLSTGPILGALVLLIVAMWIRQRRRKAALEKPR